VKHVSIKRIFQPGDFEAFPGKGIFRIDLITGMIQIIRFFVDGILKRKKLF